MHAQDHATEGRDQPRAADGPARRAADLAQHASARQPGAGSPRSGAQRGPHGGRARALSGPRAGPIAGISWEPVAVAVLTAAGFVLRARLFGQGLWSDELLTLREVQGKDLGGLLRQIAHGVENSPPLYFLLAWLSSKLGSDPALLRLPSLALGTATVPLVYLLGARSVGGRAGVVAAGFLALSPFAIYYSVDPRPYATLLFLSTLSALALLAALERGGTLRWAAWSLSVAAVLYTHYTGAAVVAAEAGWVLLAHPARRREVATAAAIAAAL